MNSDKPEYSAEYSEEEFKKQIMAALRQPFILFPATEEDTEIMKNIIEISTARGTHFIFSASNATPTPDLTRRFNRVRLRSFKLDADCDLIAEIAENGMRFPTLRMLISGLFKELSKT